MKLTITRLAIAVALLTAGWTVGRAQTRSGDFVLKVEGEVGTTRIECVRGCTLQGERDLGLLSKPPVPVYTYGCGGVGATRCRAEVHGFLQR
jgi:hypothetical protein